MRARIAALIATALAVPLLSTPAYATDTTPPRTGFEQSGGARWTSQAEEQEFLAAVDRGSDRVSITRIGTTEQDRPLRSGGDCHRRPRARSYRCHDWSEQKLRCSKFLVCCDAQTPSIPANSTRSP